MTEENKYITYFWLKYNVILLKKQKHHAFIIFSFVIQALGYLLRIKKQIHASAFKRDHPSNGNSAEQL